MNPYHKIENLFKRDDKTHKLIPGQYREPWMAALAGMDWRLTEKVDGTNIRVMLEDGQVRLGGRSDRAQLPVPLVQRLTYLFPQDKMVEKFSPTAQVCLYGEGYGAGIQKGGGLYCATQDFILFDVKINGVFLEWENVEAIGAGLGIQVVPVHAVASLPDAVELVTAGPPSLVAENHMIAEGVVARPLVELQSRMGDRFIIKIKHKDFA